MTSGGLSTAYHVVLSLVVVIAVVLVAAKFARRAGIKGPGAGLRVLDRAGLSREASVAVVAIGERRLVVGVSPHGVNLLTELPAELPASHTPRDHALPGDHALVGDHALAADLAEPGIAGSHELPELRDVQSLSAATPPRQRQATGSVLSPATWKQGVDALRELTTRKG